MRKKHLKLPSLGLAFAILFSYFLFPRVTEFSQFGAVLAGNQIFTHDNLVFTGMRDEYSLQIVLAYLLTTAGIGPILTEMIGGFISSSLAVGAIFALARALCADNTGRYTEQRALFLTAVLVVLEFKLDILYPIRFPYSYAIFGNSGFWLAVLVLALVVTGRKLGFLLAGILMGWHAVWGTITLGGLLIVFLLTAQKPSVRSRALINEAGKAFKLFIFGTVISLAGYCIHLFAVKSSETPQSVDTELTDTEALISRAIHGTQDLSPVLTHHNLRLDVLGGFPELIITIMLFCSFAMLCRNLFSDSHKQLNLILLSIGMIGAVLSAIVAVSPYILLPHVDLVARAIPSRAFNLFIVLNTVVAVCLLSGFWGPKGNILILRCLSVFWLCVAHTYTGAIIATILLLSYSPVFRNEKKTIFHSMWPSGCLRMIGVVLFFKIIALNIYFFTVYDYQVMRNNILIGLRELNPKETRILLGPGIPPYRSFNVSLATTSEWLQFGHEYGGVQRKLMKVVDCNPSANSSTSALVIDDWHCIAKATPETWKRVKNDTGITHVLVVEGDKDAPLSIRSKTRSKNLVLYTL